jgi:hypothetical protein
MGGYLPPGATHKGDSSDSTNLVTKITLNGGADWSLLDPPKEVRCFSVICTSFDAATILMQHPNGGLQLTPTPILGVRVLGHQSFLIVGYNDFRIPEIMCLGPGQPCGCHK